MSAAAPTDPRFARRHTRSHTHARTRARILTHTRTRTQEEEELDELEGMNDEERMLSRGGKRGSVGAEDESKLVTKRKVSNALLNFTLNEQIRKQVSARYHYVFMQRDSWCRVGQRAQ